MEKVNENVTNEEVVVEKVCEEEAKEGLLSKVNPTICTSCPSLTLPKIKSIVPFILFS